MGKGKKDGLIEAANGRILATFTDSPSLESSGHERASVSTAGPVLIESDTSADELGSEEQKYTSSRKRPRRDFPKSSQTQGEGDKHSGSG